MIEGILRGGIDKALEKGKVKDTVEGEVARVICWSVEEPPIPKKVDYLASLEEGEGKWKT